MREWWQKYWGGPFTVVAIPGGVFMARMFYQLYLLIPWESPDGKPDRDLPGFLATVSSIAVLVTAGIIVNTFVNQPVKPRPERREPVPGDWSGEAMFCEHANEVPAHCPCAVDCYCKSHTCKNR